MGLNELPSWWKGETKRLLWVMAVLFITVTLYQYVELPKGSFVLSIFSNGKSQLPLSEEVGAPEPSSAPYETSDPLDGPSLDDLKEELSDFKNSASSNATTKEVFALAPSVNVGNFSLGPVSPAPDEISDPLDDPPLDDWKEELSDHKNNASSNATTKEVFALAPSVNVGNFSLGPVSPPSQAPPPITTSVSITDNNGTSPLSSSDRPVMPNSSLTSNGTPPESPPGRYQIPVRDVYTLADMYELLAESRWATHSMVPRWSSKVDQEMLLAKSEIENATPSSKDLELYGPLYRNVTRFRRSYKLMEQMLKVYVYKEGDRPVFHKPPLDGIYASEGWFMKLMEPNKHFVTKDPRKAHLFYMPFSSRNLEEALYVPNSHSHKNLIEHLEKYLDTITGKYSFWNRTGGADHFLVACHDWAPSETRRIMSTCIRAMCNADVKEGFKLGKDVSLPETYIPNAKNPLRGRGGKAPSKRRILAFFAGQMHGYLRPILLQHWENVDPDMKIFGKLPHVKGNKNYVGYMQSSKYCICAKGYEVNSPRVVEAIFYECVPVIISDNFVPPFLEMLNWESFAVFVAEKDIPNLKNILQSIPRKTYLRMYMRVKKVQQHFLWHPNPVKYDLFHMILHSIWYNRVFQFKPRIHNM